MINLVKLALSHQQIAAENITDNYAWHKKAWVIFAHAPELQDRQYKDEKDKGLTPFLSRYMATSSGVDLLVMSCFEPEKPAWCPIEHWHVTQLSKNYLSQPSYIFDLYANPTKNLKKSDGSGGFTKNGRRITIMDANEQREWLVNKASNYGFCLTENIPLQIEKPINHYFRRKGGRGLHIGVGFRGGLHITDQKLFQESFAKGIGTAKGFGFGMLLIRPASF